MLTKKLMKFPKFGHKKSTRENSNCIRLHRKRAVHTRIEQQQKKTTKNEKTLQIEGRKCSMNIISIEIKLVEKRARFSCYNPNRNFISNVKSLLDQLPFESILIELVNQKLISARSYRTNCVGWLNVLFHSVLSFQYLAGCVFVLL